MRILSWVTLLMATWTTPVLASEPSSADRATARSLLDQGDALFEKGDFRGAVEKYAGAHAIMGVPTTGLPLARAQIKIGRLLEAIDALESVRHFPVKGDEPGPFIAARVEAERLLSDLVPRIPSVQARVSAAPGQAIVVRVDDQELAAPSALSPRKVNPGKHTVWVSSGGKSGSADVSVAEGEAKIVDVALTGGSGLPIVTWVGIGIAGAGLVAGAALGGVVLARNATLDEKCPVRCAGDGAKALDTSYALAHASTASFAIAGAGAVLALATGLALRAPSAHEVHGLAPMVGPGFAGIAGSF